MSTRGPSLGRSSLGRPTDTCMHCALAVLSTRFTCDFKLTGLQATTVGSYDCHSSAVVLPLPYLIAGCRGLASCMLVHWARRIFASDLTSYTAWGAARIASRSAGDLSEVALVHCNKSTSRTMLEADVGISEWTNTLVGFTGILKQR